MTDEAPISDTPVVADATPAADTSQEAVDYQQRYNSLQPEYTRATQELAQYRQIIDALSDPERAPEALSALGYEFETPEDTPEPVYEDPTEALKAELAQIKSQLAADKAEQAKQQYLAESLETLAGEVGHDFDQDEVQLLVDLAERMADRQGRPQVKAAYERLTGYEEKKKQSWVQSKKGAGKPAPAGQPGAPTFDTSTEQGRIDAIVAGIAAQSDD